MRRSPASGGGAAAAAMFAAVFVAVAAALSPFLANQFLWGDPVFDSVFSPSLGSLPVVRAGRQMPLSSAASDILKTIGGKSSAKIAGEKVSAAKWLWKLGANPGALSSEKFFRTDNPELRNVLGADGRNYSYEDLAKNYESVSRDSYGDSKYSRACADSLNAAAEYAAAANALGVSLEGASGAKDSLEKWNAAVRAAEAEFGSAGAEKRKPDRSKLVAANAYLKELRARAQFENPDTSVRTIPAGGGFESAACAMLDRKISPEGKEILALYAGALDAVAHGDESSARAAAEDLRAELSRIGGVDFASVKFEHIVNAVDPFFGGFILYALAAALLALSGARRRGGDAIVSAAAVLLGFAVLEHVFGICARMYIQARPPVTNLYSSVVFAGAAAALVGYLAYLGRRETVYALAAAVSGLLSLLVAMNLPHSGDTMGMMRAVLNSNFWLTIHVVTIMIGYCGLFLAGFMAELRLVANVFSRENFGMLTAGAARGVYAVLCFSLVFSFAGTMLGGIWADMSWGRFWGWDPKENGALMVVLWTAAAIHAKTLRLCSDRVFLALAAFGNVVGAWAWFGVNLMGVGLHSYGFVEGGWKWFFIFVASQIAVCPLAFFKYWEKTAAAPKKMLEEKKTRPIKEGLILARCSLAW